MLDDAGELASVGPSDYLVFKLFISDLFHEGFLLGAPLFEISLQLRFFCKLLLPQLGLTLVFILPSLDQFFHPSYVL